MTIDELIQEGENILALKHEGLMGYYVDDEIYDPWKRKALMFLQQAYPTNPQVVTFEEHVSDNCNEEHCLACLSILKAFRTGTDQAADTRLSSG